VPRDIGIFHDALACAKQGRCGYDDVAVIFLLTQVFVLGLALHLTARVWALCQKLKP